MKFLSERSEGLQKQVVRNDGVDDIYTAGAENVR